LCLAHNDPPQLRRAGTVPDAGAHGIVLRQPTQEVLVDQVLSYFVPLYAFMMIPVWIPLIAIAVGNVVDRLRPSEVSHATEAVTAAKRRAAAVREVAIA